MDIIKILLKYTLLANIMYKIYNSVIKIVNTLYTFLFALFTIGLFFVSEGAYIERKIKPIVDSIIFIVLGIEIILTILGRITNINNEAIQQCRDFLACNPNPVSLSRP